MIIEIEKLDFSFGDDKIFNSLSLKIERGDFIALVGPNGSGKTTLVKLINGLIKTKKGRIRVNGRIGYIPQRFSIDQNFPGTVEEILRLESRDLSDSLDMQKEFDIKKLLKRQFHSLSGGEQQKVMITLALLSNPDILILDEPTIGIDIESQKNFYRILKKINDEKGISIIFVTHDTGVVSQYFKSVMCISEGKVHRDDARHMRNLLAKVYGKEFNEILHHHEHSHNHKH